MDKNSVHQRIKDAPWYDIVQDQYGLIVGSGGIGSNLAFLLASMGLKFTIVDGDNIGIENLNAQHFTTSQAIQQLKKVNAIKQNCTNFLGDEIASGIDIAPENFTDESPINNIVFMGLDNMRTRKLVFEKWRDNMLNSSEDVQKNFILLDGRLLAEKYQIFVATKDNYEDYEKTLFDDSEAHDAPCTYKSTRFASWGIVSDMSGIFVNWCTNLVDPDLREVPQSIEKSFDCFYYNVK